MQGDQVTGEVHFNSVAPYLGIGWSGAPGNSGWHFHVDLGVLYLGDPEAEADVQRAACNGSDGGNILPLPNFSGCDIPADKQAAAEIESSLESLSLYPVVMVGAGYRF